MVWEVDVMLEAMRAHAVAVVMEHVVYVAVAAGRVFVSLRTLLPLMPPPLLPLPQLLLLLLLLLKMKLLQLRQRLLQLLRRLTKWTRLLEGERQEHVVE